MVQESCRALNTSQLEYRELAFQPDDDRMTGAFSLRAFLGPLSRWLRMDKQASTFRLKDVAHGSQDSERHV